MGIMAVMPPDPLANTRPPGIYGGNMDFNRLTAGARLYLPVHQRGALFYTGDSHAVQGDGEINGPRSRLRSHRSCSSSCTRARAAR